MPTLAIISASLTSAPQPNLHFDMKPVGKVLVTIAGEEAGPEKDAYMEKFKSSNLPIKAPSFIFTHVEKKMEFIMKAMEEILGYFAARGYVVVGNTVNAMKPTEYDVRDVLVVTYTLQK